MRVRDMEKIRVLFVCMGNICRSPTAHGIFRRFVEQEGLADRILMIHKGRSVLSGDLLEITARHRAHSVLVRVDGDVGTLNGVTSAQPTRDHVELTLDKDATPQQILTQLLEQGKTVHRFEVATPSLHEIFLDVVGEADA